MPTLTDAAVSALPAQPKPYKLTIGKGLYVQVQANGSKLWRMAYRFDGKQKTLAFGVHPAIKIKEALKARDHARKLLDLGVDPSAGRQRKAVIKADMDSFESVAKAWFAAKENGIAASYSTRIWSRIEADILPDIGHLKVSEIEPPTLLAAIRKIEDRGAVTLAKRIKNYCGEVFRFAIAEGKATRDPSADIKDALKKAPTKKHRKALKAADLPGFFGKLATYDGEEVTKQAILLTTYTFVRTNEIRFAAWSEFEGLESSEPLWRIPAERMKMRRDHLVPLPQQVVQILSDIRALKLKGPHLFPYPTKEGVISQNRMIYGMYRMGFLGRATIHGMRTLASTVLNESGRFEPDWIEMQLAHVDDSVRGVYNAAQWLAPRREMMRWYANFLDHQRDIGSLL